jgi:hypothetical protein
MGGLATDATTYAAHRWPIFPIAPRGKEPLTLNGFKSATTDPAQIHDWWTTWPDANIGFVPGRAQLLVLDLDGPEGESAAQALGATAEPTLTAITARGRHLYFQHPGGHIGNQALSAHLDVRADAGYVLLPPSVHPSGAVYRWIGKLDEVTPLPPLVLAALQSTPARSLPLPELIAHGQRNSQLFSLAGSLQRRAASPAAIRAALEVENAQRCRPPLPETELEEIVESVQRYPPAAGKNGRPSGTVSDSPARRYRLIPAHEWAAMPPPPWLIDRWLPLGTVDVLFGASGLGKSFVSLDLAYAVARGVPWLGHAVSTPGPVVYLAGEGGGSLKVRCAAYEHYYGVGDVPLVILPDLVRLAEPGDVLALIGSIAEQWTDGIRLLVIDTLAAACAGLLDENKTQDMTRALTAIEEIQQRTGATILVIHHTGWSTQERERGASALRGRWDVAISLNTKEGAVQLTVPKARDFEPPSAIPLRLHAHHGSMVVLREDRGERERPLTTAERLMLRCLREIGGSTGASSIEWERASEQAHGTFYRARQRLLDLGAVALEGRRYRVAPLGEAIL